MDIVTLPVWRALPGLLIQLTQHGSAPEDPVGGRPGGGQGHGCYEVAGEAGGEQVTCALGGAIERALVERQLLFAVCLHVLPCFKLMGCWRIRSLDTLGNWGFRGPIFTSQLYYLQYITTLTFYWFNSFTFTLSWNSFGLLLHNIGHILRHIRNKKSIYGMFLMWRGAELVSMPLHWWPQPVVRNGTDSRSEGGAGKGTWQGRKWISGMG